MYPYFQFGELTEIRGVYHLLTVMAITAKLVPLYKSTTVKV